MIQHLHISGFKCFRDLQLPQLGQINLFVGKNNTGKSSVLEAVELFVSDSPESLLRACARRTTESADFRYPRPYDSRPYDSEEIARLVTLLVSQFHREQGEIKISQIEIRSDEPKGTLKIDSRGLPIEIIDHELRLMNREKGRRLRLGREAEMFADSFTVIRGSAEFRRSLLEYLAFGKGIRELDKGGEQSPGAHPQSARVAFLSARGFTQRDGKRLWDQVSIAGRDEAVLEWMRLIEPEIKDLRYIGDENQREDRPHLRINGDMGFTPMASLGDGLTRIFHIALAMASVDGGVLLIDEFENGLHWSVQKELWRVIGEAAQKFSVQVFATTHSRDCMQALVSAQNDRLIKNLVYVYRMERDGENILPYNMPLKALESALDLDVEVR